MTTAKESSTISLNELYDKMALKSSNLSMLQLCNIGIGKRNGVFKCINLVYVPIKAPPLHPPSDNSEVKAAQDLLQFLLSLAETGHKDTSSGISLHQ